MTTATTPTAEPVWWGSNPSWTPRAVRVAHDHAESGDLSAVANLCDALQSDARIRGTLETRKNALFGCTLDFEPAGHKARSTPICRALKDDGEFWQMAPESALSQIFIWGLLANIGLGELTWRLTDTLTTDDAANVVQRDQRWTQILTPKHLRNLRKDPISRRWLLMVDGGKEIEVNPGDGRWLMFSPFGENSPWSRGLYWPLALLWLSKTYSDFDWGRRNEARGRAALVGESPEGSTDEDRKNLAQDIAALRTRLGIVLPPGYKLDTVEFGAEDHQTFKTRIDWADAAIGTLVLGQNPSAEVRASSLAAPKTNDKIRQDYLELDAEAFATCCHDHMLCPFANVRYGDAKLAPWPKWNTEPPEDVSAAADVTDKAARALAALLKNRVPVDVEAYCEKFKIPLLKGAAMPTTPAPSSTPKDQSTEV